MLFKTPLVIQAAQLPQDFIGDPQEFFEALIERMEIMSPAGTNFFVVGDTEPNSNQGPWLKGGTQWWVFDVEVGRYVPLDISASLNLFVVSSTEPAPPGDSDPELWLRTFETRGIGWYGWDGVSWRALPNVLPNGATSARPTNPVDLEKFFDTDIHTEIVFERGAWRTVAGVPGDIKPVAHSTLADALRFNPGWQYLGEDDQSIRGRIIGVATQDPGATPVASFATDSGITVRASGDQAGEETHTLSSGEHEQHTHEFGHAAALGVNHTISVHRVDDGLTLSIPAPAPPNFWQSDGQGDTHTGTAGDGPAGTKLITALQYSKTAYAAGTVDAQPHNNIQPTVWFWWLVKL